MTPDRDRRVGAALHTGEYPVPVRTLADLLVKVTCFEPTPAPHVAALWQDLALVDGSLASRTPGALIDHGAPTIAIVNVIDLLTGYSPTNTEGHNQ